MLRVCLKYIKVTENEEMFDKMDNVMSTRVKELDNDQFAELMGVVANYNMECQPGEEYTSHLVYFVGELFIEKNMPFFDKSQFIAIIAGYATSGIMKELKETQLAFEQEIKNRITTFSSTDIAHLVRLFAQAETASPEFYGLMDKYIGSNLADVEPRYIYPILKSFYDSGHARPKLFIKLQQQIINNLAEIEMSELCAILRLYVEMDVQQSTFYEKLARNLELRLETIDESGLVNALIAFKQAQTLKQLSIVSDLEKILHSNLRALSLSSLSQLLFCYSKVTESVSNERKNTKLVDALKDRTCE